MKNNKKQKRAQSEIIGFALIIIIVAILILIFFSISLNKQNDDYINSFEAEAFIQAFLQYTTDCAINYEPNYQNVRKLIFRCINNATCVNELDSCEILNETLSQLLSSSWQIGEEWPIKGYVLNITHMGNGLMNFKNGNLTQNSKGAIQSFDQDVDIYFMTYY